MKVGVSAEVLDWVGTLRERMGEGFFERKGDVGMEEMYLCVDILFLMALVAILDSYRKIFDGSAWFIRTSKEMDLTGITSQIERSEQRTTLCKDLVCPLSASLKVAHLCPICRASKTPRDTTVCRG